jgi:hypothetical protein
VLSFGGGIPTIGTQSFPCREQIRSNEAALWMVEFPADGRLK